MDSVGAMDGSEAGEGDGEGREMDRINKMNMI